MKDRFVFEQEMMACWNVVEDIETFMQSMDRREIDEDEILNYLIGIKTIYNMKFEQLFETFEYLIEKGDIN